MITERVLTSSLLGLILFGASVAHAATVSFSDTAVAANVGDTISLNILMDFTDDATLGGGTDIFYDASVLSFQSFDFSTTTLALDPTFSRVPDVLTNELEGMAFGSFAGLTGPGIVGTLTFQAIATGDITLSMAETDNPLGGGSFTSATTFLPQVVSFGTADVAVVPVPAAVWLFGSGLLGLVGVARKHKAA
jgi:hypothetical protein